MCIRDRKVGVAKDATSSSFRFDAYFDFKNCLSKVLHLDIYGYWATTNVGGFDMASLTIDVQTNTANITSINSRKQTSGYQDGNPIKSELNATFLLNRDELENAQFTVNMTSQYLYASNPGYVILSSWWLEDAGSYAIRRQVEYEKAVKNRLALLEVGSTTDIDL